MLGPTRYIRLVLEAFTPNERTNENGSSANQNNSRMFGAEMQQARHLIRTVYPRCSERAVKLLLRVELLVVVAVDARMANRPAGESRTVPRNHLISAAHHRAKLLQRHNARKTHRSFILPVSISSSGRIIRRSHNVMKPPAGTT